ncbi:MAG: serine--tRNA ligase, partial [Desulfurococcaceae archaeon]
MSWSILTLLRENPELLKEHVKKRFMDPNIVDRAYKLDVEWRRLLTVVQELRHRHNVISREIPKLPEPERQKRVEEAKKLLEELGKLEERLKYLEAEREEALLSL